MAECVRDLSQPLKPTTVRAHPNAKHVMATATLANIMTSKKKEGISIPLVKQSKNSLTITTLTHCGDCKLLVAEHEDETTASEEETSQSLRRRA